MVLVRSEWSLRRPGGGGRRRRGGRRPETTRRWPCPAARSSVAPEPPRLVIPLLPKRCCRGHDQRRRSRTGRSTMSAGQTWGTAFASAGLDAMAVYDQILVPRWFAPWAEMLLDAVGV